MQVDRREESKHFPASESQHEQGKETKEGEFEDKYREVHGSSVTSRIGTRLCTLTKNIRTSLSVCNFLYLSCSKHYDTCLFHLNIHLC